MKTEDLVQRVRKEVIERAINKAGSNAGSDLNKVKLSIIEFKYILYDVLKSIEIDDVNDRW